MTTDNTSYTQERTQSRSKPPRHLLLACLGLLATLLLVWLVVNTVRTPHPPPIKIALAAPLSGPQRQWGEKSLDAVRLYFSEVNRQGGIQGHPLDVTLYDDENKPDVAAERAKEIAASPALAVIGHVFSWAALPAGLIYKAASI